MLRCNKHTHLRSPLDSVAVPTLLICVNRNSNLSIALSLSLSLSLYLSLSLSPSLSLPLSPSSPPSLLLTQAVSSIHALVTPLLTALRDSGSSSHAIAATDSMGGKGALIGRIGTADTHTCPSCVQHIITLYAQHNSTLSLQQLSSTLHTLPSYLLTLSSSSILSSLLPLISQVRLSNELPWACPGTRLSPPLSCCCTSTPLCSPSCSQR
jgi:hypothetical protein